MLARSETAASPARPAGNPEADPALARCWLVENALAWGRWCEVAAGLLVVTRFPVVSQSLGLALILLLALGIGATAVLLRQRPDPERLRMIRRLATALGWGSGVAFLGLLSVDPTSLAPMLLPILVIATGVRYRLRGAALAALGAVALVAALIGAQVWVLEVLAVAAAGAALLGWTLVIVAVAVVVGAVVWAADEARAREAARQEREREEWCRQQEARLAHEYAMRLQQEQAQLDQERAALWWQREGLTEREWEVLQLSAQGLGRERIGARLCLSPMTVKTHIQNIGHKWNLEKGGQRAIVAEAQQRGMPLPLAETPPPGDQQPPGDTAMPQ